ncbi:hypothetical protein [Marinobacter sediminum]|uniref:hypothetical protein n=1 Tax=Marinobacter sediminum TaxID=256323 RepID=UPI001EEF6DA1|nr:hypothetical protein [Marinobacter sediminum]
MPLTVSLVQGGVLACACELPTSNKTRETSKGLKANEDVPVPRKREGNDSINASQGFERTQLAEMYHRYLQGGIRLGNKCELGSSAAPRASLNIPNGTSGKKCPWDGIDPMLIRYRGESNGNTGG